MRIVSLLASTTEMVAALGLLDHLVGRSHECDEPPAVRRLPALSRPLLDPSQKSAEIDRDVRRLMRDALSIYEIDAAALKRLRPDVILTQSQCEVCAVSPRDLERAACDWLDGEAAIVSLSAEDLDGIWADVLTVGRAVGAERQAEALIGERRRRLAELADATERLKARPTLACIEWIEPLMAAGNWVPELVRAAGGHNLFGAAGSHSPWLDFEALVAADPEVIVIAPCGFDIARTRAELAPLVERPGWAALRAVQNRRVYLADGNRHFNRSGPRIVETAEMLAEMLHPGCFDYRHAGAGWQPL